MEPLLTVDQVAAHIRVTRKTVNAWVRRGLLVPTDLGGVRRFARVEHTGPRAAGTDPNNKNAPISGN